MKAIFVLVIMFYCASRSALAQFSTESKNGTNAVLLNNSSAAVNITDPKISIDWTNRSRYIESGNHDGFVGFGTSVKNKTGLGKVINNDAIAPEAELHTVFGFFISNAKQESEENPVDDEVIEMRINNESMMVSLKAKRKVELVNGYTKVLNDYAINHPSLPAAAMIDTLSKQRDLRRYARKFQDVNKNVPAVSKSTLDELQKEMQKVYDAAIKEPLIKEVRDKIIAQRRLDLNSNYYRISFFGFGNINASSFKQYVATDTVSLEKSFKDVNFNGGKVGIGVNGQYSLFRFGITYAFNYTNNFKSLTETEYVVRNSAYIGTTSTITREKKITAYDGGYGNVLINELNIDLIANFKLNPQSKNYLLLNPYSHSTHFSRTPSRLPSTWDLGIGVYSFKSDGKFLGGLYFEIPDIHNTIERNKEVSKQDIKPILKRFTIGLTTKFTLQGIYSW